ncbi:MAG: hypothetical protein HBSAPP02_17310 [Phycisphaerae bacterium]|nr:MAG: hypothetical protein HBSAPP02_17310 [Phycisphaerae bacterium]
MRIVSRHGIEKGRVLPRRHLKLTDSVFVIDASDGRTAGIHKTRVTAVADMTNRNGFDKLSGRTMDIHNGDQRREQHG